MTDPRPKRWRRRAIAAPVAAGLFLVASAGDAAAQMFAQLGSANEPDNRSQWTAGFGYEHDFPVLPVSVGVVGQVSLGREFPTLPGGVAEAPGFFEDRVFPARAFGTVKVGFLPTPGMRVYLGGGPGFSTRLGAEESARGLAGLGLAGFELGLLSLEVQFQRDFGEEPVNRWVYLLGVSF